MQALFIIEDVFDIAGSGCILAPGIPYALGLDVKAGEALLIVSPDGAQMRTRIAAFEMVNNRRRPLESAAFALPRDVKKQDLKIGSVVYLVGKDDARRPAADVRRWLTTRPPGACAH